ncbi:Odorant receptor [Nesidiocoris tenuis]|uniref:Odorant receptor n=1 Tax=Nesidiocoris tenuis TaxID=355587 RepID=A0ABN7AUX9_9HEMI|nr:Odorant receptor [Nesidiocoris tenuis]
MNRTEAAGNTSESSVINKSLSRSGPEKIKNVSEPPPALRRPTIDLFQIITSILKNHGIARPTGGLRDKVMKLYEIFVSITSVYTFVILTSGMNFKADDLQVSFESLTFFLCSTPSIYMMTVCLIRKKMMFALFDRINHLLAEIEDEFGPEMIRQMKRECKIVFLAHAGLYGFCIPPPYIVAYYKYYFDGVKDAAPYTTNIPFGRKENVHYNTFWQVLAYYYPITGSVTSRVLMGSLAISTSRIIEKTRWKFEQLSEHNNRELLRQAVRWHSEVIQIVNESNYILGSCFAVESLMAMTYICNACFMLSKFGLKDDKLIYQSVTVVFIFACLPLYFCMSGHKIANESDKLYSSISQNRWYHLSPEDRKDLILPLIVAKTGISWNFRKLFQFDMTTYLYIIRQSYSFYTLISAVDSGK